MGSFYAEDVLKIKTPRVGLLNNGTEPSKGTELQLGAYELLERVNFDGYLNFVGNIEANDAMNGACDVLVSDGFTGNILLKSIEGTAALIMSELKSVFLKSTKSKLSALLIRKGLSGLRQRLNPDAVGGTAMLGISKPVIKAHGSSNAVAIMNAIRQAVSAADMDIAERLQANISKMKISSE